MNQAALASCSSHRMHLKATVRFQTSLDRRPVWNRNTKIRSPLIN